MLQMIRHTLPQPEELGEKLTLSGEVDVVPNICPVISNAMYSGRSGDATSFTSQPEFVDVNV